MKPWNESYGCHYGVIADDRVYTFTFAGSGNKKGEVCYMFAVYDMEGNPLALEKVPGKRTLKRLAKKFLDSRLEEIYRRNERGLNDTHWFLFHIESGTSQENRAAFLAAVVAAGLE